MLDSQQLFIKKLKSLNQGVHSDNEDVHYAADKILIAFLRQEGFKDLATAYDELEESVSFYYI